MAAHSAPSNPVPVSSFTGPGALTAPTDSTLTLTCRKCTREQRIPCDRREGGLRIAHDIGWRDVRREPWAEAAFGQAFVCPRCPGGNKQGNLTLEDARMQEALRQNALEEREIEEARISAEYCSACNESPCSDATDTCRHLRWAKERQDIKRAIADAAIAAGNAKPGDVLTVQGHPELGEIIA